MNSGARACRSRRANLGYSRDLPARARARWGARATSGRPCWRWRLGMAGGAMKVRSVLLALGFAAALVASVPACAQIVSHRAAYSLSLGAARANSGITAVEGAMVFDWQEVCEGWTLNQR